jgi:glycosyltransferase involved in cell wall biosynthesis
LAALASRAREAAAGEYGWDTIARRTLDLYAELLGERAGGDPSG